MPKTPGKMHRGAGRVAFLARVEDIKALVDQGYPYLAIYERYAKELGISYSQFARYVAKYITTRSAPRHDRPDQPAPVPSPGPQSAPAPSAGGQPAGTDAGKSGAGKPAFKHDATGGNRDDLI